MKTLFFVLTFAASMAFAKAPYSLGEKAILGNYKLKKADKKADYQNVTLAYGSDFELVLTLDNGQEFYPQSMDASGVFYDSQEEYNCEDSYCGGISYVKATLQQGKNKTGQAVPQITLLITEAEWIYPDDGESFEQSNDTEYVFIWDNANDIEMPPVVATFNVNDNLEELLVNCNADAKKAALFLNEALCPSVKQYIYQNSFLEDWPLIIAANHWDSTAKKVELEQLKKGFFKDMRASIRKAGTYKGVKVTGLLKYVDQLENYLENAIYDGQAALLLGEGGYGAAQIFIVNEEAHTVDTLWFAEF